MHFPFWLNPKKILSLFRATFNGWLACNAPRLGASLAYYTVFSIAPLFVVALAIAGLWFGEEAARRELYGQLATLVGPESGEAIQSVVAAANRPKAGSVATLIATIVFFFGAGGVFVELQDALNTIWSVQRRPGHGVKYFIRNRILSFAMVLGIGFLLLVSLILSAVLSGVGQYLGGSEKGLFWQTVNFFISLGVITIMFALMFKILPDVKLRWRYAWAGGLLTALLFNLGKWLLGLYLGRSSVASAYGAAGSLVIVLLWVYYSAQILFFGAQFTRSYATMAGSKVEPGKGAEFVELRPQIRKKTA